MNNDGIQCSFMNNLNSSGLGSEIALTLASLHRRQTDLSTYYKLSMVMACLTYFFFVFVCLSSLCFGPY